MRVIDIFRYFAHPILLLFNMMNVSALPGFKVIDTMILSAHMPGFKVINTMILSTHMPRLSSPDILIWSHVKGEC